VSRSPATTRAASTKSANDLRDKRLLTLDFDKLSQLELATKKQDIQFGRNKQEWQIVKPKPARADNFQVEEIVRKAARTPRWTPHDRCGRQESLRRIRFRDAGRYRKGHRCRQYARTANPQEQRRLLRKINRRPWHLQSLERLSQGARQKCR